MTTGFIPPLIVTKPLYIYFHFLLVLTSWEWVFWVCYLLCDCILFYLFRILFFFKFPRGLFILTFGRRVSHGDKDQPCRCSHRWRWARQPACVYCARFLIWKGREQQPAGWFQDAMKCRLWTWFVNVEHHAAMHHTASVETNYALNSPEIHPVKTALLPVNCLSGQAN